MRPRRWARAVVEAEPEGAMLPVERLPRWRILTACAILWPRVYLRYLKQRFDMATLWPGDELHCIVRDQFAVVERTDPYGVHLRVAAAQLAVAYPHWDDDPPPGCVPARRWVPRSEFVYWRRVR